MKKILLIIVIALIGKISIGQEDVYVRHISGIKTIDGTFNVGLKSIGGEIGMGYFFNDNWIGTANIEIDYGQVDYTYFGYYLLNLGMNYTLFQVGENVYIQGKLLGKVGFENLTSTITDQTKDNLLLGFSVGINAEIYLFKTVGLNIQIDQTPYIISDIGKQYINFGIGVKYYIY